MSTEEGYNVDDILKKVDQQVGEPGQNSGAGEEVSRQPSKEELELLGRAMRDSGPSAASQAIIDVQSEDVSASSESEDDRREPLQPEPTPDEDEYVEATKRMHELADVRPENLSEEAQKQIDREKEQQSRSRTTAPQPIQSEPNPPQRILDTDDEHEPLIMDRARLDANFPGMPDKVKEALEGVDMRDEETVRKVVEDQTRFDFAGRKKALDELREYWDEKLPDYSDSSNTSSLTHPPVHNTEPSATEDTEYVPYWVKRIKEVDAGKLDLSEVDSETAKVAIGLRDQNLKELKARRERARSSEELHAVNNLINQLENQNGWGYFVDIAAEQIREHEEVNSRQQQQRSPFQAESTPTADSDPNFRRTVRRKFGGGSTKASGSGGYTPPRHRGERGSSSEKTTTDSPKDLDGFSGDIKILKRQYIHAINNQTDRRFGIVGANYKTAKDSIAKIKSPVEAMKVYHALVGVYRQLGFDESEITIPATIAPLERQAEIQKKLVEITNGLAEKMAEVYTQEIQNHISAYLAKENKVGAEFKDENIPRAKARILVYDLSEKRRMLERHFERVASQIEGPDFAERALKSFKDKRKTGDHPANAPAIVMLPGTTREELIKQTRERVIKSVPERSLEAAKSIDVDDPIFTEIAGLEMEIKSRREFLAGKPAVVEGGRTISPETVGAFKCDPDLSCETLAEIKEYQLRLNEKLSELRIVVAQKRIELANEKIQILKEHVIPGETRLSVLREQIAARVGLWRETWSQASGLVDQSVALAIGEIDDKLAIAPLAAEISDRAYMPEIKTFFGGVADRIRNVGRNGEEDENDTKDRVNGNQNPVEATPAYVMVRRNLEGLLARRRIWETDLWKGYADLRYSMALDLRRGRRFLFLDISASRRYLSRHSTDDDINRYLDIKAKLAKDRINWLNKQMEANPLYKRVIGRNLEVFMVVLAEEESKEKGSSKKDKNTNPPRRRSGGRR